MPRSIHEDTLSPGALAIVAVIGFGLAFALGAGVRLLQEAAGRNVGANLVLWIGVALLAAYIGRAMHRYRRIRRATPPDIAERLEDLVPPSASEETAGVADPRPDRAPRGGRKPR